MAKYDVTVKEVEDYQVIITEKEDYIVLINQKQGLQGDVTPEAIAAKEAAQEAAANTKESEINSKESELNAKESEINAAESAESAANDAALVYSYVNAPVYDPNKTYNYHNPNGFPDIVSYIDGYAYRCIGDNIQGESPSTSLNWVRIPEVAGDLFVIVKDANSPTGFHITQSLTPGKKESDFFEKKPDGSIEIKPIVIDGKEGQRDFYPRDSGISSLGQTGHRWKGVYAVEGHYEKLYSTLYNGYVPEDSAKKGKSGGYASLDTGGKVPLAQISSEVPVSNPQKTYIDAQDAATLASAKTYTDAHNTSNTTHVDIRNILKTCTELPDWDDKTYTLTFKTKDGVILKIDLPIEGLSKDLDFDPLTKEFIVTKQDGSTFRVPASALVDIYVGFNGAHIQTVVDNGNIIKATLKAGSITETELSAALLAKIDGKAEQSSLMELRTQINNMNHESIGAAPTIHTHTGEQILTDRGNAGIDIGVSKELRWSLYGNNHAVIENSSGTYPGGNTNPQFTWAPGHPVLMGYNGINTYGVRVDSARHADSVTAADTTDSIHLPNIAFMKPNWNMQPSQPSWLWGGWNPDNMYPFNPSNFSVNQSTYASVLNSLNGPAGYALGYSGNGSVQNPGEWGRVVMYYEPNGLTYGVRCDRADSSDYANNANVSEWTRRLNANDHGIASYNVQTNWTGAHWHLRGYHGDSYHGECRVGYADSAGWAGGAGNVGGYTVEQIIAATLGVLSTSGSGAAFAGALQVIGMPLYFASSATSDTVNDLRIRNNAGILTFEKCTVANGTKGSGTWIATGTNFMQVDSDGNLNPVKQ